ncbi:hypothetical protein ACQ4PT_005883 [Festuca glaucescens]
MHLFVATDQSESRRLGLQTLISGDVDDARRSRYVATRTIAASRRAVCLGGDGDPESFADEEEEGGAGDVEEEGGCWVMYGWRRRLRRLPPLIPSLRRAGSSPWALTRTRTADGRVVITREPAPQRGRVVARRLDGRLILDLVDSSPMPPPPRQPRPPTSIAQEIDVPDAEAADEEKTAICVDIEIARSRDVPAAVRASIVALSSPVGSASASPVPAVACFEAVIRTSPLRKMPVSLPRMVH